MEIGSNWEIFNRKMETYKKKDAFNFIIFIFSYIDYYFSKKYSFIDKNAVTLGVTNAVTFITADITPFSLLNKIEQEVFDLIENNPKITRKEIAIKINKTIRTVQRITDKLVDKKMLIRVGSNQYGYWEVIKKIRS